MYVYLKRTYSRGSWLLVGLIFSMILSSCAGARVSKEDARWANIFMNTAKAHLTKGEYRKAEFSAKKAIDRNPELAEAYRILALAYYMEKKTATAVTYIKKAIALDANNSDYHNDLGGFLLNQKRCNEALKEFQSVLHDETYREPGAALYNMGEAYRCLGDDAQAIAYYEKSLLKDPNQDRPYYWMGVIARKNGNEQEAISMFKEAAKINSYNIDAVIELCLYYCSEGNVAEMKRYCLSATQMQQKVNPQAPLIRKLRQCIVR